MPDLRDLLTTSRIVMLVDWPRQQVPATLYLAGYEVVGHEPDGPKAYTVAAPDAPAERRFPLDDGRVLATTPIDALPDRVDIVCTFRPAEEQMEILQDAIARGARAFWIEPGESVSDEARQAAGRAGLPFIEGVSIADAVRDLGAKAALR